VKQESNRSSGNNAQHKQIIHPFLMWFAF